MCFPLAWMIGYRLVLRRFRLARFAGVVVIRASGKREREIRAVLRMRLHTFLVRNHKEYVEVYRPTLYWVKGNAKRVVDIPVDLQF